MTDIQTDRWMNNRAKNNMSSHFIGGDIIYITIAMIGKMRKKITIAMIGKMEKINHQHCNDWENAKNKHHHCNDWKNEKKIPIAMIGKMEKNNHHHCNDWQNGEDKSSSLQ